MKLLELSLVAD